MRVEPSELLGDLVVGRVDRDLATVFSWVRGHRPQLLQALGVPSESRTVLAEAGRGVLERPDLIGAAVGNPLLAPGVDPPVAQGRIRTDGQPGGPFLRTGTPPDPEDRPSGPHPLRGRPHNRRLRKTGAASSRAGSSANASPL